jgi:fluoride exporter
MESVGRFRTWSEERAMGSTWMRLLVLSTGGALGVNARYWLALWIDRRADPQFPWATFTINVSGSFAIGVVTALLARWAPHPHARLFLVVGFLGGYTTFSSFSLEALALVERGALGRSLAYMGGSVVSSFVAVALGVALGHALAPAAVARSGDEQKHEVRDQEEHPDRALVKQHPTELDRVDRLGGQPVPPADPMLKAAGEDGQQDPKDEERVVREPAPEEHGS